MFDLIIKIAVAIVFVPLALAEVLALLVMAAVWIGDWIRSRK